MMKSIIRNIFIVSSGPILSLIFIYMMWLGRFIDKGRAVSGIAACILFGMILIYITKALQSWVKKQRILAAFEVLIASYFGWFWFNALKTIELSLKTGNPTPMAVEHHIGFLGIEGFWGIASVILAFYIVVVCGLLLTELWIHYDPIFELKFWLRYRRRK